MNTITRQPAAAAENEGFAEHRVAMQDGSLLYVREYGSVQNGSVQTAAMPLLCLPGYTRNCRDFHALAARHGKFRRVLCPDMRGRGKSTPDPTAKGYAVETAMADLLALLSALRLERCVVLGTSFGGVLGMALAVLRPRALAGLILNDAGPQFDSGGLKFIADYVGAPQPQADWQAAAAHGRDLVGKDWDKDDADWLRIAEQGYSRRADGLLHADFDPAIAKPLRAFATAKRQAHEKREKHDMWAIFRALAGTPTLLLHGALSHVLKQTAVDAMLAAKPDLEYVQVPGVGHAPFLDEVESREAIDGFLTRFP